MDKLNPIVQVLSVFSTMAISLTAIIALLSTVFKPIRKGVVWIYKKLVGNKDKNEEVLNKINDLENAFTTRVDNLEKTLSTKIQEVSDRNDENEKDRIRWEILDFANSCRNGRKHSKEEYNHVIELRVKYEKLLEKTGDENGVFEEDYKYIQSLYMEGDFLC